MYDKSDLIKETFITTLNKKYQFMVPSVISIKKQNEIFKIVSPEEYWKCFVNRDRHSKELFKFSADKYKWKYTKT